MMTDWTMRSLHELIAAPRAGGYDAPLGLAEEFLRRGAASVDALCTVLADPATWEPPAAPENMLPVHAMILLGGLRDRRAAPMILAAARAHDLEEYLTDDVHFRPGGTLDIVRQRERAAAERRAARSSPARAATNRSTPKVGRNQPCPCGSGSKYKRCCGR